MPTPRPVTVANFPSDNAGAKLQREATNLKKMTDATRGYFWNGAAAAITTAGAATYTAAQILGGFILRDPNGAGRTDVLPTAALLVAAMSAAGMDPQIGDLVRCKIINNADAAETITISEGSGGTITQIAATRIIPQNTSREVVIRLTGVASGSEAYVVYM